MADEDDIESFWEGRQPPLPPEERRRQAIETGLSRSRIGQAIQQERRVEDLLRRVEYDPPTPEIVELQRQALLQRRLGEVGRRRLAQDIAEITGGSPGTNDPSETEHRIAGLHYILNALGFPATIELSQDTRTLYLTFHSSLNAEIHFGQNVPVTTTGVGETTISIER